MLPLAVAVCWTGEHHEVTSHGETGRTDRCLHLRSVRRTFLGVLVVIIGYWKLWTLLELLEDSYQLMESASNLAVFLRRIFFQNCEDLLYNKSTFNKQGQINTTFGTPVNAILFLTSIICGLIALDFTTILCIDNFFSCISLILEMCASIRLRQIMPEMKRPYRIPVSTFGLTILLSPMFLLGTCVLLNEYTKSWTHFCFNTFGLFLGLVLWYVTRIEREMVGRIQGIRLLASLLLMLFITNKDILRYLHLMTVLHDRTVR